MALLPMMMHHKNPNDCILGRLNEYLNRQDMSKQERDEWYSDDARMG